MPDESTTPDLVEFTRAFFEAANCGDMDALMSAFAPDGIWEAAPLGVSFKGRAAIRGFLEDWIGAYEEYEMEPEDVRDFGNGVALSVLHQTGRPPGSTSVVRVRSGFVAVVTGGVIVQVTSYTDIDAARAAAERLAEERG
jgi:ketosteroid isomerase-like protein